MNHQPKRSERIRNSLPYALLLLAGLACIVLIALSAVGRQGIGWLLGQNLQSELEANYNEQITLTIPAVDATRIAELQATDEAGLLITPGPGTIVTVPPGQFTPGPTVIALITDTPTPTPTPRPTNTFTPTSTNTPTPTNSPTRTRTPTPLPTFTPTPITPTATNTAPPPPPPPPPPPDTFTPTPSPTTVNPAPPPPAALYIANIGNDSISLVWSNESASDSDFQRYRVLRSYNSGGPYTTTVAIIPFGTVPMTSVADNEGGLGLVSGIPYYYTVQGEDTIQASAPNPEVSGTTGPIATPNPTPIDCDGSTNCGAAGGPPGTGGPPPYASVDPGQYLILDLGSGNGILNGNGYDFVFYEREADPIPTGFIQMDAVTVELSLDGITWYTAFAWNLGNEALAQNSNVAPLAYSTGGVPGINLEPRYCDTQPGATTNEIIFMQASGGGPTCDLWGGLWGTAPINTGIAIDINGVIPPPTGEGYRYLRITAQGPQPAEVDAIERLH
ncbi:MAG TPA: hypothetical protein VIK33_09475 [Anaerolineae bacterium]